MKNQMKDTNQTSKNVSQPLDYNNKPHDSAYKYLFKNKKIFLQLLKSFVNESFVKEIELENLEIVDKSFISSELLDRESDLIYKINYSNKEYFIYILMEFQSTVDKSLPVRMLNYITMLYDQIYKNSKKGLLPNIFPVLIYNGKDDWNVPLNINELIEKNIPEKYIPSFQYYPIIEKDIPDKTLEELHNLVSAVIYLEKQKDEDGFNRAIEKVIDFIKKEDIIEVRMFYNWIKKMFKSELTNEHVERINSIMEAKSMLTLIAERIEQRGFEKGKIEGIQQGKLKGKQEGKLEGKLEQLQNTLIKLMKKKYGLTANEEETITQCLDMNKLEEALDLILFTENKKEIFDLLS